jgi:hypothetical protein
MPQSFALRADYENVFEGGTINVNGQSVNILERLNDGDGVITAQDDENLLREALLAYPALKKVSDNQAEELMAARAPEVGEQAQVQERAPRVQRREGVER